NSAPIYNDASGTNSVAVKASQSITFPAMLPQPVNSTFTLPATASSGLPVTYSTSTPNRCTISGSTANLLSPGYCGVYASQPGNSNFFAAATVGRNIDIVKEAQTIAFPSTPPQLANSTFTLAATSSSGLPITYTSTTPSICTISGSTANPLAAGDCGIHASQPGNSLYAAASTVSRNIQIVKASQIITFTPMPAQPANTTFTLAATASSGLPVTYATSTPSICTISGGTANLLATGYCGIYASQPGNSIYAAATTVGRNLQVLPAY
ncbi:MAG TPA: hypothetical protein VL986_08710, partial [Terracidiphilus sp.]|nr:hypothetical protein [Terracidiphilus sp.]